MKLTARQKYDYRDLERGEAQLIRVGHALWRDRSKLGDTVAKGEGINAALEERLAGKEGISSRTGREESSTILAIPGRFHSEDPREFKEYRCRS
jgi:hypothetical protein